MQDKVMKDGKWDFDEDVAKCFDNMLERSIPDYQNMRELVFRIGSNFVKADTAIMDIGCSNGISAEPFILRYDDNEIYLLDVSEPMLQICRKKYERNTNVKIFNHDLRQGVINIDCSLIMSILTLQFTPIEYRQKIIDSVYKDLTNGGAFIMVEKVLGNTYSLDNVFVENYYQKKKDNHYTNEQIKNKRKSLEGVLVPITSNWNIELLKNAGFKEIDCFWRYLNFAGYIAIK